MIIAFCLFAIIFAMVVFIWNLQDMANNKKREILKRNCKNGCCSISSDNKGCNNH